MMRNGYPTAAEGDLSATVAAAKEGDAADDGSQCGSSLVDGSRTGSKMSSSGPNNSAFTAPSRYRNSGAFVHGTKFRNFKSIMVEGLKAAQSEIFMIDEVRSDGRVPGLEKPPEILIFIDEIKARSENMMFEYDTKQGTWKTRGIGGVIRPWFFQKVVDQRKGPGRGNVLFQSKDDPMMHANVLRGGQRPKLLIHATYWENISGIFGQGIVPAKNPTSELRQQFKDLLVGAENHVHTVNLPQAAGTLTERSPACVRSHKMDELVVSAEGDNAEKQVRYRLDQDVLGLERPPDAFFVIDTERAKELGVDLNIVQSADRQETVFVQGAVPPELLTVARVNEPVDLPDSLRAKIVNPQSFADIPVIDLSSNDEATLVEQMRYACEVVGFMQIKGHGVSEQLQEQHMKLQREFFALSQELKDGLRLDASSPVRGYFGKGGEDLEGVVAEQVDVAEGQKIKSQSRKDTKEALDTNGAAWVKPAAGTGYVADIFSRPSRLPSEEQLPGFAEVLETYAQEMFRLSKRLLSLMAQVLNKPPDFFDEYLTRPVATHRLLHYWPIKDFQKEIGVGAHTDYGLLTILKQDSVGGLQVANAKDDVWVHCCPIDGAFVVNIGDMLERWTGHRFKSTVHRVVNVSPLDRYSVPYFLEPNMETVIAHGALVGNTDAIGEAEGASETAEAILEKFYRASGQLK